MAELLYWISIDSGHWVSVHCTCSLLQVCSLCRFIICRAGTVSQFIVVHWTSLYVWSNKSKHIKTCYRFQIYFIHWVIINISNSECGLMAQQTALEQSPYQKYNRGAAGRCVYSGAKQTHVVLIMTSISNHYNHKRREEFSTQQRDRVKSLGWRVGGVQPSSNREVQLGVTSITVNTDAMSCLEDVIHYM